MIWLLGSSFRRVGPRALDRHSCRPFDPLIGNQDATQKQTEEKERKEMKNEPTTQRMNRTFPNVRLATNARCRIDQEPLNSALDIRGEVPKTISQYQAAVFPRSLN
jgi:hypothetical protein